MNEQHYFEQIRQLLYSTDANNTELALQLIEGLENGTIKSNLQEIYAALADVFVQIQHEKYHSTYANIASIIADVANIVFVTSMHEQMNPLLRAWTKIVERLHIDVRRKGDLDYFTDALMQFLQLKDCFITTNKTIYFALPADFHKLQQLEYFSYSSEYPDLPNDFLAPLFLCPNIQKIELSLPYLKALPPNLCHLKQLFRLDLFNFPLSDLPAFFADLPALQFLEISFLNEQNHIPDVIFNMPHLRHLILDELNINTLPEQIFKLSPQLYTLELRNTKISPKHINYWHERLHRIYPTANIIITTVIYNEDY